MITPTTFLSNLLGTDTREYTLFETQNEYHKQRLTVYSRQRFVTVDIFLLRVDGQNDTVRTPRQKYRPETCACIYFFVDANIPSDLLLQSNVGTNHRHCLPVR